MRVYRPGMLQVGNYERAKRTQPIPEPEKRHHLRFCVMGLLFLAITAAIFFHYTGDGKTVTYQSKSSQIASRSTVIGNTTTECSANTKAKLIVVSLSQQHLWACNYQQVAFSSAVVTGYTGNPADTTPTGTYKIFTKEHNVTLTGNDGVSTWHDPVSYWMPFLFNKYGAYGFHDATWRSNDQFGHISTSSPNASHGCVECPLATAKWLYSWATVGTNITIKQV